MNRPTNGVERTEKSPYKLYRSMAVLHGEEPASSNSAAANITAAADITADVAAGATVVINAAASLTAVAEVTGSNTVSRQEESAATVPEGVTETRTAVRATPSAESDDDRLQTIGVRLCAAQRKCRERVAAEVLAFAAELLHGKREYELATGTGHGKRNPQRVAPFLNWAAEQIQMSASLVGKIVRMAERAEAEPVLWDEVGQMTDVSMRLMFALSDERDAAKRLLAVGAHRTGGAPTMRATLTGHPLARVMSLFTGKAELANVPSAMLLPKGLAEQFPEVAHYATVGEVREAISQPPTRAQATIEAKKPASQIQESKAAPPPVASGPTPPEPTRTVTSSQGPCATLVVLPAGSPGRRTVIALAATNQAGTDAIVAMVEHAASLGLDLTKPNQRVLGFIETGLADMKAADQRQRALFQEAMDLAFKQAIGQPAAPATNESTDSTH